MKSSILCIFLLFSATCLSQDFYITTTGSDSNPGTEAQPWATLQHAANTLLPGQTVHIKAGTYFQETWVNVSGTAGNYITFTNFGNDQVIIDGGSDDTNQTELFVIFGQNYLKVNGLHFTNSTGNFSSGIYISNGSSNIEITNNKISNVHFSNDPNAAVNSSTNVNPFVVYNENGAVACSNILVQNNEIFDCRTGFSEALTLSGNVDGFEVSNNMVHDISNIGIDIAGGYGVSTDPANDMARNGVVKENTVYNCVSAYAVSAGIYVDGGHDVIIERNTCYGNGRGFEVGCEENGHVTTGVVVRDNIAYQNLESGIGIGGYNFPTTGKVVNCQVLNNTFYDNNTSNTSFNAELLVEYTENCTIKNNIFSAQNTENLLTIVRDAPAGASSTGLTLDYNLYHHPDGAAAAKTQYEGNYWTGFSDYQTNSGKETNSVFATADFVDAGAFDFDIASSSAAINAGDPTFTTGANETDFAGNTRMVNGRVDIGAFESQMVLPVEFIDFYGQKMDDFIELKWLTDAEINHRHFEIERGGIGQNFEKIGIVERSVDAGKYYFLDKNPMAGLNYYRLRQVDLDGTYSYSSTIAVDFFTKEIQVFPNPVKDVLQIRYDGQALKYSLFCTNGQKIQSGVFKQNAALDLEHLDKGIYILKMENGGEVEVRKIVKK